MTGRDWCEALDALSFSAAGERLVFVHRLAFRSLVEGVPTPDACLGFFDRHRDRFLAAAAARPAPATGRPCRLHLNSRHIRRALGLLPGPDGVRTEQSACPP